MKRSPFFYSVVVCSLLLVSGCVTSRNTANVRDTSTVLAQLGDKGIDLYFAGPISQTFLSTPGEEYTINQNSVQLFVYKSQASALLDVRQVGSQELSVFDAVHFYQGGNIVALYFGDDPHVRSALADVVGPLVL